MVFLFICIASHCCVMSLLCLCVFVTLNRRLLTYLLTTTGRSWSLDGSATLDTSNVFVFAKHHSRCSDTAALSPTDAGMPFTLHRRQFPIRPAFAMTIKCAGTNAEHVRRAARRARLYSWTAVCVVYNTTRRRLLCFPMS